MSEAIILRLLQAIVGTFILWFISSAFSIFVGLILASGSQSSHTYLRCIASISINISRGIPTSLLVIAFGMGAMRFFKSIPIPIIYIGTPKTFQLLAWSIVFALAIGSAGHLAKIFCAAYRNLGEARLDQLKLLGLSHLDKFLLIFQESASVILPSLGARLVHHLHNTAFVALFPVVDLFGFIHEQANATFKVFHFVLIGCIVYVSLSGFIWSFFRILESVFAPPRTKIC